LGAATRAAAPTPSYSASYAVIWIGGQLAVRSTGVPLSVPWTVNLNWSRGTSVDDTGRFAAPWLGLDLKEAD